MIEAAKPICKKHKKPANLFHFGNKLERICELCVSNLTNNSDQYSITEEKLLNFIKEESKKQIEMEGKAFVRHRDLMMFAVEFPKVYKAQEDRLLKKLVEGLEKDKIAIRSK